MNKLVIGVAVVAIVMLIIVAGMVVWGGGSDGGDSSGSTEKKWTTYDNTHLFMGTAKPGSNVILDDGTILALGDTPDAAACQTTCALHDGCVAYTWHNNTFGNSFDNKCHGATSLGVTKIHSAAPGRFSGILEAL